MRFLAMRWTRAAALVASIASVLWTPAKAGELLVIPYTCRVVDGAPMLTPSSDQGYRILGPREEREFTACSPVNPEMCRRWKVYRFDVDCGGRPVPWVSLSAAADTHSGRRSWIEGGRLHIEMPPRWGMYPDDPCARGYRAGWRDGPMSRYCSDRRALQPADVVMPDGFAPMLDLDGIFVADSGPTAASPSAAPLARADLPVPKPHAEAKASKSVAEKTVKVPEPPKAADPAPASPTTSKSVTPPAPVRVEPPKQVSAQQTTVTEVGTPAEPTIINQPDAGPATAQLEKAATAGAPQTAPSPASPKEVPLEVALKETMDEPTTRVETSALPTGHHAQSEEASLISRISKAVNPTLLSVGGATMLGLLALLFAARRSQEQRDFPLAHDIATVSFEGQAGGRELVRSGRSRDLTTAASGSPPAPAAAAQLPANLSDAMPQTREEALQILGMGVAPDVSDTAIKKIVDGLRLSWHPDYAKTPQDKELRELRMKQINAAWEIIAGRCTA